jgi:hypothetical protein
MALENGLALGRAHGKREILKKKRLLNVSNQAR